MQNPTQERVKALLRYDSITGDFYWLQDHGTAKAGIVAGSISNGYLRIYIDGNTYGAHRVAWVYMTGAWSKTRIDHRDTCRSNNKWENLRQATHSQNIINSGVRKNNKIGLKGVYITRGRWECRIMVDGKRQYIGRFDTPQEAHAAYSAKAAILHGEFARTA